MLAAPAARQTHAGTGWVNAFSQVVWQVGLQVDLLYRQAIFGIAEADTGIEVDSEGFDYETASAARLSRELCAYRLAGIAAAEQSPGMLSFTCDKSRVFGRGLLNSAFCLPSNAVWWSSPKVGASVCFSLICLIDWCC